MILERLKEYIDHKGISIAAFERSIGMSNASFGKSLKNKGAIGSDKLENILKVYPDLSVIWLMTGKGEMIGFYEAPSALPTDQSMVDKLLAVIQDKSEEIGRLKARITQLESQQGGNAYGVHSSGTANAG